MLPPTLSAEVTGMYTGLTLFPWILRVPGILQFWNRIVLSPPPPPNPPRTVHTGNSDLGGQVTFQGSQPLSLFSLPLESLFVQGESSVIRNVLWLMW